MTPRSTPPASTPVPAGAPACSADRGGVLSAVLMLLAAFPLAEEAPSSRLRPQSFVHAPSVLSCELGAELGCSDADQAGSGTPQPSISSNDLCAGRCSSPHAGSWHAGPGPGNGSACVLPQIWDTWRPSGPGSLVRDAAHDPQPRVWAGCTHGGAPVCPPRDS